MSYESEPGRVPARSSRTILAVAAVVVFGLAVIVGGLTALDRGARLAAVPSPPPTVGPTMPSATPTAGVASGAPTPQLPPVVACHGLGDSRCTAVARSAVGAVRALDDPAIPLAVRIDVWADLLCGSTFDCPPQHLQGRRPAGSAVVGFGQAIADVWVNVTEIDRVQPDGTTSGLEAWVIRSGPS